MHRDYQTLHRSSSGQRQVDHDVEANTSTISPPAITPALPQFQLKMVGSLLAVMALIGRATLFFLARRKAHPDIPDNYWVIPAMSTFFILNAICCFGITSIGLKLAWQSRNRGVGPLICGSFAAPLLAIPIGLILSHQYFFPDVAFDIYALILGIVFMPVTFFGYKTINSPLALPDDSNQSGRDLLGQFSDDAVGDPSNDVDVFAAPLS